MKNFLISAVLGLVTLALINLCAPYTGAAVPVSPLSLTASALLGPPGAGLLVILNLVL